MLSQTLHQSNGEEFMFSTLLNQLERFNRQLESGGHHHSSFQALL